MKPPGYGNTLRVQFCNESRCKRVFRTTSRGVSMDSSLFFTCSLIELLGRMLHCKRGEVVSALGEKASMHI